MIYCRIVNQLFIYTLFHNTYPIKVYSYSKKRRLSIFAVSVNYLLLILIIRVISCRFSPLCNRGTFCLFASFYLIPELGCVLELVYLPDDLSTQNFVFLQDGCRRPSGSMLISFLTPRFR